MRPGAPDLRAVEEELLPAAVAGAEVVVRGGRAGDVLVLGGELLLGPWLPGRDAPGPLLHDDFGGGAERRVPEPLHGAAGGAWASRRWRYLGGRAAGLRRWGGGEPGAGS